VQGSELAIRIGLFYGFILFGYLIARLSGKGESTNTIVTKLLVNILVPLLVIYALLTASPASLEEIPAILALALLIHLSGPVVLFLLLRGEEIANEKKGGLFLCSTFNNALFIPLPIVLMFLGPVGVPIVVMFSLTQMTLMVSLGSFIGATYGGKTASWRERIIKAITFPPLIAAIFAGILLLLGFVIPGPVVPILSYSSDITTYLALLSVGLSVGTRFSTANLKDALRVVLVRQAIVPLIALPFVFFMALSAASSQVILLEALMPAAVLNVVYAGAFDLETETVATIVTVGTILLLPIIPLLPFFMG
jgi:predicted permease